jgi:hypothetical protein
MKNVEIRSAGTFYAPSYEAMEIKRAGIGIGL